MTLKHLTRLVVQPATPALAGEPIVNLEKIQQTRTLFESTFQAILNQINCDIEDIDKYI